MTRYIWILLTLFLFGFSQVHNTHDNQVKTDEEFKNVYDQAQRRQYTLVLTTPNYQDLQNGEMVVYSSSTINPTIALMLRVGTTIYVSPYFSIMRGR